MFSVVYSDTDYFKPKAKSSSQLVKKILNSRDPSEVPLYYVILHRNKFRGLTLDEVAELTIESTKRTVNDESKESIKRAILNLTKAFPGDTGYLILSFPSFPQDSHGDFGMIYVGVAELKTKNGIREFSLAPIDINNIIVYSAPWIRGGFEYILAELGNKVQYFKSPNNEWYVDKYFDVLNNIKEQLFDAPADVKSAFNQIIKYFDTNILNP